MSDFVRNIWYFAALSRDIGEGKLRRVIIAGEPVGLGRENGGLFGLRDICPHRAAPLTAGCIKAGTVECPYHGWRFATESGACVEIPSRTAAQAMETERIRVRTYPVRETGALVWVWIGEGEPDIDPPALPLTGRTPVMDDQLTLNCHVDHAVIGLMDPAHGPYVHSQWWWRSEHSAHDKAKAFAPSRHGFTMSAHSPSSNSFAYKLLGGRPVTEIAFELPGIRTEHVRVGERQLLSLTAVTPEDADHTRIRQVFFTDMPLVQLAAPLMGLAARRFLRQDADMVDLQQQGLRFDPKLMLLDDADTQAKWYHRLKREWAESRAEGRAFANPVKARTLHWRS